ncbi:hypothetical protein A1O1_05316 [Capronia coronata CBS 617.96]|uniref:Transcriptional regulatory protein DEP1 n=1 Tax=Capronia coronata CBS 617.96 TaxID=1182541 RepID=W9YGL8_9EURO|nr:uncharacterized protein A1O1_05316 [Capronia coronata CBS 617.96]EXJ88386.1 hypothetical protein A1O1_05316 [Capronia coronata CBS 617.96]
MDSAADSLIALSNVATATTAKNEPLSDDDRSSSLSELDDDLDDVEDEVVQPVGAAEGDSEAETERLQVTPDKLARKQPLQISPSKLAHRLDIDMRPEIESITESPVSSPISSHHDSEIEDGADVEAEVQTEQEVVRAASPSKRKREASESDAEEAPTSQRRRTGSVESEDQKSQPESENGDSRSQPTRDPTVEAEVVVPPREEEEAEEQEEGNREAEMLDTSEDSKEKARSRPRRKAKGDAAREPRAEDEEEAEAAEDTDAVDENDADAAVKSEEEHAKRMAAMDALTTLEKHFAALRDRLYDERIAGINHELALLSEPKPSHPELLRQLEAVRKYRDEKFEVEQKLLVYKIGALKTRAVAERSQIHSQYFQTVRDIREKYLERISEHFYRIQRDRFKTDSTIPSFTIPYPERRSQQILQQTAYNKEVSILSGIAKYVGFPAAPELAASKQKDVEDDIQKMGISVAQNRPLRPAQRQAHEMAGAQISGPQAEEQFLEQTPWANPQHPIHRLSRQNSNRSPMTEFVTPANQQRTTDGLQPAGSASTIVDPAAQISSAINTPYDEQQQSSTTKVEPQPGSSVHNYRLHSTSPLDTRRVISGPGVGADFQIATDHSEAPTKDMLRDLNSSPLTSRAQLAVGSPPRAASARPDKAASRFGSNESPFRHARDSGITAGSGFSGTGRFSIR